MEERAKQEASMRQADLLFDAEDGGDVTSLPLDHTASHPTAAVRSSNPTYVHTAYEVLSVNQ